MGEVCWKKYKGKTVLYQDYRNSNQDEIMTIFKTANELAIAAGPDLDILVFANFQVTEVTGEVIQNFKSSDSQKAAKIIKKSAIIGDPDIVNQMKKFYTHFTNGNVEAFTNAEAALDWLIEE